MGHAREIEDLRRVVKIAQRGGRRVVVGGHSLGGSITTAYATWDFGGQPGAKGLSGLVYIDGGSSPTPVTPDQARQSLQTLESGSPWLSFGGIVAPFAGLFNTTGATGVLIDPNAPSLGQAFRLLPANLKPPVPATGTRSTPRPRLPRSRRRRPTSAASPRAAIHAAGTRPER